MIDKKHYKYLGVVFLTLIVIIIAFQVHDDNGSYVNSEGFNLENMDEMPFDRETISNLINLSYYEDDLYAIFNSVSLNSQTSLYHYFWYSELSSLKNFSDVKIEYKQDFNTSLYNSIALNSLNSLNDLYYILVPLSESDLYFSEDSIVDNINRLTSFNDGLYCNAESDDHCIRTTLMVVEILSKYNILGHNERSEIFQKLILISTSTIEREDQSDLTNLVLIACILDEMSIDLEEYQFIIDYLNNERLIETIEENGLIYIGAILYYVNDRTFNINTTFENVNVESLQKLLESAQTYTQNRELLEEPQLIYYSYLVLNFFDTSIGNEYIIETRKIIEKNFDTEFRKNSTFNPSLIETYYGVVISDIVHFDYNREKVINFLYYKKSEIMQNMGTINSNGLIDIYFLIVMNEYFEENLIDDYDRILLGGSIDDYLNEIKYDNDEIVMNVQNVRFSVEILHLLNYKISSSNRDRIVDFLNQLFLDGDIKESVLISEVYLICKYTDIDDSEIRYTFENLYYNGGFRYYNDSNLPPDVISTAKMFRVEGVYHNNGEVLRFLNDLFGEKNTFINYEGDDLIQLRVIYYYLKIYSIISEVN